MNNLDINFPIDKFEELIIDIGYDSLKSWINFWERRDKLISFAYKYYGNNSKDDWIWGLVFPLISQAYQLNKSFSNRKLIGLSALPGTGKSTLGRLIEKLSSQLDFRISVVSIDDFYLPCKEMREVIKNNPWRVSRGFPGSHSLTLMEQKFIEWKETGKLIVPVFDKSLRGGLGDRSSWREEYPDIVVLEGWFLGINPTKISTRFYKEVSSLISEEEFLYVQKIQKNLHGYQKIWKLIDNIWHLKPEKFKFMNNWKTQQEEEMLINKGFALKNERLSNFLRMLNTCIPHDSFDEIKSNTKIILNEKRQLIWVGMSNY